MRFLEVLMVLLVLVGAPSAVRAADTTAAAVDTAVADEVPVIREFYTIEIRDHRFYPARLVVPAGRKIKLRIENFDKTPEEFESYELNREKIVTGGGKITIFVGPLKAGVYPYFGEFNPKTAQGVIVAKDLK